MKSRNFASDGCAACRYSWMGGKREQGDMMADRLYALLGLICAVGLGIAALAFYYQSEVFFWIGAWVAIPAYFTFLLLFSLLVVYLLLSAVLWVGKGILGFSRQQPASANVPEPPAVVEQKAPAPEPPVVVEDKSPTP